MGIVVHTNQYDNGIFALADFMSEINKGLQNISFSGVRAHHQNGIPQRHPIDSLKSMNVANSCNYPMAYSFR